MDHRPAVVPGDRSDHRERLPGYSYARNDISDLGVPERGVLQGRVLDSPLHAVMNAGFSDGIWERGSVYTFLAWQVMTGVSLLHRRIQGAG